MSLSSDTAPTFVRSGWNSSRLRIKRRNSTRTLSWVGSPCLVSVSGACPLIPNHTALGTSSAGGGAFFPLLPSKVLASSPRASPKSKRKKGAIKLHVETWEGKFVHQNVQVRSGNSKCFSLISQNLDKQGFFDTNIYDLGWFCQLPILYISLDLGVILSLGCDASRIIHFYTHICSYVWNLSDS